MSRAFEVPPELLKLLWDREYVLYLAIVGLAVLIYDTTLTFSDEIRFVWRRQWSSPKMLYIINRYGMILTTLYFVSVVGEWVNLDDQRYVLVNKLYHHSLGGKVLIKYSCQNAAVIVVCSVLVVFISGSALVLERLILLWQCSRQVGRIMAVGATVLHITIIGFAVASAITLNHTVGSINITAKSLGIDIHTCITNVKPNTFVGIYAPSVVLDAYAFMLLLLNALSRPRLETVNLLNILRGEGVLFLLICPIMHAVNFIVAVVVDPSLTLLTVIFGAAMVCNAIARFFLCICAYHDDRRGYGDVSVNTELTWQIGRESESYAGLGGYSEGVYSSVVSESSH